MLRDYELMYIVRPELDEEAFQASVDSVKALVEAQGGEVVKTTIWGKRRLAYEVAHMRDGLYVIAKLRLPSTAVGTLERALRIHDTVFRHLLVVDEVGFIDLPEAEVEAEAKAEAPATPELAAQDEAGSDEMATDIDDAFEPVAAGVDRDEES